MKGFCGNIEELTLENNNFRKVIYTTKNSQLVLMSLKPNEDIGEEVHDVDQFFRIEKGYGKVIIDDNVYEVKEDFVIIVPAGAKHNVINESNEEMKIYTLYMPPHHKDGIIHHTKEEALNDEEHFDGQVTE